MARPVKDLSANQPILMERNNKPELPVKDIAKRLTVEEGQALEITTRTAVTMANAAQFCLIYTYRFKSEYASARIGQVERLAISMGGQGRRDLIDALQAGGAVPGEYYSDANNKKRDYPIFEKSTDD